MQRENSKVRNAMLAKINEEVDKLRAATPSSAFVFLKNR
jgi:hypothetical protein